MEQIRFDGRYSLDYRPLTFEVGVLKVAMGSARVTLENSVVLASIRGEIGSPAPDHKCGSLSISVNCDQAFAGQGLAYKQKERDLENLLLSSFVGTSPSSSDQFFLSLHESGLVIQEGKRVWDLTADITLLSCDGDFTDISFFALRLAFMNTFLPVIDLSSLNTILLSSSSPFLSLNCNQIPLAVKLFHFSNLFLIDPRPDEIMNTTGSVVIVATQDGTINLIKKGGKTTLELNSFSDLLSLASVCLNNLFRKCQIQENME
ncbi:hypothetical protein RCL1_001577 [Eukaryota sp. TZLM3-RCL]